MSTAEERENLEVPPSQSLPSTEGKDSANPSPSKINNPESPKADETGTKKDAQTGSTLTASPTEESNANKETISPPAPSQPAGKIGGGFQSRISNFNKEAAKAPASSEKQSATNPSTVAAGKLGVTEFSTETDNQSGAVAYLKRSDGVTLQFQMTFTNKQDLYSTKNMFDLIGKMINLPEDKLREEYPSFVKG